MHFSDHNTISACDTSIEAALIRLESGLYKMLHWFTENSMKANPSEFQIMS